MTIRAGMKLVCTIRTHWVAGDKKINWPRYGDVVTVAAVIDQDRVILDKNPTMTYRTIHFREYLPENRGLRVLNFVRENPEIFIHPDQFDGKKWTLT